MSTLDDQHLRKYFGSIGARNQPTITQIKRDPAFSRFANHKGVRFACKVLTSRATGLALTIGCARALAIMSEPSRRANVANLKPLMVEALQAAAKVRHPRVYDAAKAGLVLLNSWEPSADETAYAAIAERLELLKFYFTGPQAFRDDSQRALNSKQLNPQDELDSTRLLTFLGAARSDLHSRGGTDADFARLIGWIGSLTEWEADFIAVSCTMPSEDGEDYYTMPGFTKNLLEICDLHQSATT